MSLEPTSPPGAAHLFWGEVPGAAMYDVISGDVDQMAPQGGYLSLGAVRVLATGQTGTSYTEGATGTSAVAGSGSLAGPVPAPGKAFFYLVQSRDAQGMASGYGTESAPWPQLPASCDGGCPGETAEVISTDGQRKK